MVVVVVAAPADEKTRQADATARGRASATQDRSWRGMPRRAGPAQDSWPVWPSSLLLLLLLLLLAVLSRQHSQRRRGAHSSHHRRRRLRTGLGAARRRLRRCRQSMGHHCSSCRGLGHRQLGRKRTCPTKRLINNGCASNAASPPPATLRLIPPLPSAGHHGTFPPSLLTAKGALELGVQDAGGLVHAALRWGDRTIRGRRRRRPPRQPTRRAAGVDGWRWRRRWVVASDDLPGTGTGSG